MVLTVIGVMLGIRIMVGTMFGVEVFVAVPVGVDVEVEVEGTFTVAVLEVIAVLEAVVTTNVGELRGVEEADNVGVGVVVDPEVVGLGEMYPEPVAVMSAVGVFSPGVLDNDVGSGVRVAPPCGPSPSLDASITCVASSAAKEILIKRSSPAAAAGALNKVYPQ